MLETFGEHGVDAGSDSLDERCVIGVCLGLVERRLDPCMSEVLPWDQIPQAHTKMMKNEHKPGNMAVLVQSPRIGLSTFEEVIK